MRHVRLLPYWLGAMLFFYQHISALLNLNLGIRFSPDRLLFLVILTSFLAATRGYRHLGKIERFMIAFTFWCIVSWLFKGSDAGGARFRWLNTIFQLSCFPFLAYYIGKWSDYTDEDLIHILNGVLVIQCYLVFESFAEHYHIHALVWPKYILNMKLSDQVGRLNGPFSNSSMMGAALVMNFGCLSVLWLFTEGMKKRIISVILFLTAACIYMTTTRTVWLGWAILLMIFYFSQTPLKKLSRNILTIAFIAALLGVGSKFSVHGKSLFSERKNTIEYRLINLKTGLHVFTGHPLIGIGYGGFATGIEDFAEDIGQNHDYLASGNENTWLGILVELGLLGLSLYVIIYAMLVLTAYRDFRMAQTADPFLRPLAALSLSVMLYTMLNWNTGDLRFHLYDPCLAFLLQGILASRVRNLPERTEAPSSEPTTETEGQFGAAPAASGLGAFFG